MKIEIKAWSDTKNVDLRLVPENDSDRVILVLVGERKPEWSTVMGNMDVKEIVFRPVAEARDGKG